MSIPDSLSPLKGSSSHYGGIAKPGKSPTDKSAFGKVMAKEEKKEMPRRLKEELKQKQRLEKKGMILSDKEALLEEVTENSDENNQEKASVSLFDLSSKKKQTIQDALFSQDEMIDDNHIPLEPPKEPKTPSPSLSKSPLQHHSNEALTEKKEAVSPFELASRKPKIHSKEDDESGVAWIEEPKAVSNLSKQKPSQQLDSFSSKEEAVIHVAFLGTSPNFSEQNSLFSLTSSKEPLSKPDLASIISQMVESLSQLQTEGQTTTSITLKHPPLFEGVNIIMTSFDTAHGEINLSFENLTQQAKNLLDLQANKEALKKALEEVGYNVHIITTTTEKEHFTFYQSEEAPFSRNQENKDQQNQKQEEEDQD